VNIFVLLYKLNCTAEKNYWGKFSSMSYALLA